MEKKFSQATLRVQGGWNPKKGEPRVLPIYQSTTFKYETSEQMAKLFDLEESGYFYTRLQNPTNDAVAAKIAALEGGIGAMLTSSEAANFLCYLQYMPSRRSFRMFFHHIRRNIQLIRRNPKKIRNRLTFVNADDSEEEISKAFRPNTKALFGETISNPSIDVLDIEKFARIAI